MLLNEKIGYRSALIAFLCVLGGIFLSFWFVIPAIIFVLVEAIFLSMWGLDWGKRHYQS
jgi:hypothetical protein